MAVAGDSIGSVVIRFLGDPDGFNRALDQMGTGLQQLSGRMASSSAAIGTAFTRVGDTLTAVGSKLVTVGETVNQIGTKAAVLGTALATPFIAGLKPLKDFDDGFHQVLTLFGTKPPPAEFIEQLKVQVKDLAQNMGVSLTDAVNALYQAISSGVPADNVISFLETSVMTAKAGATDMETSVKALAAVVNAYGEDVISATEASDLMFQAVNYGMTTFPELAHGIGRVAPVAAQFKVDFKEITGLLGALTRQGIDTDEALTGIRQAMIQIGSPTDQVLDKVAELNQKFPELKLNFSAAGLEADGLVGTLAKINKVAEGDKQALLELLPEVRAMTVAAAAGAQEGEVMAGAMRSMEEAAGITKNGFEEMRKSIGFLWEQIKTKLSVSLMELSEQILPDLKKKADQLIDSFAQFTKWTKDNPEQFRSWASAAWDVAKALGAIWLASKAFSFIAGLLGSVLKLLGGVSTAIGGVVKAFSWVKQAVVGSAAAAEAMRKGMTMLGTAGADAAKSLTGAQRVVGSFILMLGKAGSTVIQFGKSLLTGNGLFQFASMLYRAGGAVVQFGKYIVDVARGLPFLVGAIRHVAAEALAGFGLAAGAVGTFVAAAGFTIYWWNELRVAANTWADSAERGVAVADKAREKFNLQGESLNKLKKNIEEATSAEEKRLAQESYAEAVAGQVYTVARLREAEKNKQIDEAIKKNGELIDSVNLADSAWLIMKETGVDAMTAVKMASIALTDAQVENAPRGSKAVADATNSAIEMYERMGDADKKAFDQYVKTQDSRREFDKKTAAEQTQMWNEALQRNQFASAKEAEISEAKLIFKQREVTMDQAILAVKNNFTDQEIKLLERGLQAQEIIAQRKTESRQKESSALAEQLSQDADKIGTYIDSINEQILDLTQKKQEMIEKAREIVREDPQQYMQMMENARAFNQQIGVLEQERDSIANAATAKYAENVAKKLELDYEQKQSTMEADEVDRQALQNRMERLGKHYETVVNSLGQYKAIYQGLSDDQKAMVDNFGTGLLESQLKLDSSAQGVQNAYTTTAESMRTYMQAMTNETAASGQAAINVLQTQSQMATAVAPQLKASYDTVGVSIQQNRIEHERLTESLNAAQQQMNNMKLNGMEGSVVYGELATKAEALKGKLQENDQAFNQLSVTTRMNRTEMVQVSEALVKQIGETEQLILKKREEGQATTDLDQRLISLNAQYNVLQVQMKNTGIEAAPLQTAFNATGAAASDTGMHVQNTSQQFNNLNQTVDVTKNKLANELPVAAQQGAQQTENIFMRTYNNLVSLFDDLWQAAKRAFDFSQHGSPSMNDYVELGLRGTKRVYANSIADFEAMFTTFRDNQVAAFNAGLGAAFGSGGGMGVQSKTKTAQGPEKQNKRRTTTTDAYGEWVQMPDGSWVWQQGLQQTTTVEPIEETEKATKKVTHAFAQLPRRVADLDDVLERLRERLSRLRDTAKEANDALVEDPATHTVVQGVFGIGGKGIRNPNNEVTERQAVAMSTDQQDQFARKVGAAVAGAITGRMGSGFGPASSLPSPVLPPPAPQVQHQSADMGRIGELLEELSDPGRKKRRRDNY